MMKAGDIVVLKERFKRVRKGFVLRPEPNFSSPIGPKYWKVRWFGPQRQEDIVMAGSLEVVSGEG
jgi:hypothetical protein